MTVAYQLPVERTEGKRLGRQLFRKQLLHVGDVRYKDTVLHFTPEALKSLVDEFNAGSMDAVPFQLADAANQHTQDPERTRGEVIGLEAEADGLYGLIEMGPEGAKLIEAFPNLAVSASLEPDAVNAVTGHKSPLLLKHVLGTIDPVVKGMSPWVAAQLAQSDIEVIDLTAAEYQGAHMDDFNDEEREVIRARREAAAKPPAPATAAADDDKPLTEAEEREVEEQLAKLGLFAPAAAEPVGAGAALSADGAEAINLAVQEASEAKAETAEIRRELAAQRWSAYRTKLLTAGVPKSMVDFAAAVLDPDKTATINLSVETPEATRGRYEAVIYKLLEETPRLDLSRELGARMPSDDGLPGDPLERSMKMVAQFKHDFEGADAPGGTA